MRNKQAVKKKATQTTSRKICANVCQMCGEAIVHRHEDWEIVIGKLRARIRVTRQVVQEKPDNWIERALFPSNEP